MLPGRWPSGRETQVPGRPGRLALLLPPALRRHLPSHTPWASTGGLKAGSRPGMWAVKPLASPPPRQHLGELLQNTPARPTQLRPQPARKHLPGRAWLWAQGGSVRAARLPGVVSAVPGRAGAGRGQLAGGRLGVAVGELGGVPGVGPPAQLVPPERERM